MGPLRQRNTTSISSNSLSDFKFTNKHHRFPQINLSQLGSTLVSYTWLRERYFEMDAKYVPFPISLKVLIKPISKINGPNVKPISLNQIKLSNFSGLMDRQGVPGHLFSRFSFGELSLPLPWSHMSTQSTHKHQQFQPFPTCSLTFPHSTLSLPLSTRKNKMKREKRGE